MKAKLEEAFLKTFGAAPQYIFFCPGRVNLIGEHIDYNGGKVMPCAISLGTYLAVSPNTENVFCFRSLDFSEKADIPVQPAYTKEGKEWFYYPLGVIHEIFKAGHRVPGLDMVFSGNLPIGAGLSSSASIEVLTAYALQSMFGLNISNKEVALLSKRVENDFIGLNSGIMDQFAVAMGRESKAILLDCDTLDYEYLPFNTGDYILAIVNSNKQRTLADSKYNERFAQCRAALQLLNTELNVAHLCDIDLGTFEAHRHLIDDPVLEKRARHVVSENERVKKAKAALTAGKLERFGELMYASHQSLKELYEVSGKELDTIVEFCQSYADCAGARMTGAGFGGCAIALVKKEKFADFADKLIQYYDSKIGYKPGVFASIIGDGVKQL